MPWILRPDISLCHCNGQGAAQSGHRPPRRAAAGQKHSLREYYRSNGVGGLLRAINGYHGALVTRCALRLAPLTFVRPGELRKAEWVHFDLAGAEWHIPGERMKMGRDLIVPLARQAMDVLRELHPLTGHGQYLFPSVQRATRPMSENTVNAGLRRLGYTGNEMTGHGFRAMARTILDEVLGYRVEWIEHQLAHEVRDHNGRAYNRAAFLQAKGHDARLG